MEKGGQCCTGKAVITLCVSPEYFCASQYPGPWTSSQSGASHISRGKGQCCTDKVVRTLCVSPEYFCASQCSWTMNNFPVLGFSYLWREGASAVLASLWEPSVYLQNTSVLANVPGPVRGFFHLYRRSSPWHINILSIVYSSLHSKFLYFVLYSYYYLLCSLLYSCNRQISVWDWDRGCQRGVWTSPTKMTWFWKTRFFLIVLSSLLCSALCTQYTKKKQFSQWPPLLPPGPR